MRTVIRGLYLMIFCQVVLESFPISSSGHLVLLEKILQSFGTTPTVADLPPFFDHFLHGPTILVLLIFFRKEWFAPLGFLFKNFTFDFSNWSDRYKKLWGVFLKITFFVFVTSFITVIFYFLFGYLKKFALLQSEGLMLFGFFLTTILLFSLYFKDKKDDRNGDLTLTKVIILGLVQGVSFLPGISRFGSTYVVARWLGVSVKRSFQFTFLMQFPLIVAAFFDASSKMFFGEKTFINLFSLKVCVAFLIATVLAYFALYVSYSLAIRRKLWYLGFYMLLPLSLLIYFIVF